MALYLSFRFKNCLNSACWCVTFHSRMYVDKLQLISGVLKCSVGYFRKRKAFRERNVLLEHYKVEICK